MKVWKRFEGPSYERMKCMTWHSLMTEKMLVLESSL